MYKKHPFCSVVILNYFGEKIIEQTVKSLLRLDYPQDKFEIIIIDNNSKDKSKSIISELVKIHKNIRYSFLDKNLGFAAGNNVGIRLSKGKYVALLNNDCVVDTKWLCEIVKTAEKDDKVFAVNSKILLYPVFFRLDLYKPHGLTLESAHLIESNLLKYSNKNKIELHFRERNEIISFDIPFILDCPDSVEIILTFKKNKFSFLQTKYIKTANIPQSSLKEIKRKKSTHHNISFHYKLSLEKFNLRTISFKKIQNAGILVFQDGYGRDIGANIRSQRQDFERDSNQYQKEKEVYAACGAAVLYRTDILKKIGCLNEDFFMYYEDVDLSERAHLCGYKIVYSPKAIVKHLHAASSGEWSLFFLYHAERGRLLHVFFNFPLSVFIYEYIKFTFRSVMRFLNQLSCFKCCRNNYTYIVICVSLLIDFPHLLKRKKYYSCLFPRFAIQQNYQKILSGYWYTK